MTRKLQQTHPITMETTISLWITDYAVDQGTRAMCRQVAERYTICIYNVFSPRQRLHIASIYFCDFQPTFLLLMRALLYSLASAFINSSTYFCNLHSRCFRYTNILLYYTEFVFLVSLILRLHSYLNLYIIVKPFNILYCLFKFSTR